MKKRVCIFNGDMSRGGGTERITAVLANLLKDRSKHDVVVLNLNNETHSSYYELRDDVDFHVLQEQGIVGKIMELRRFVIKEKIDILINVDVMLGIYSIPATFMTRTKMVAWEMFNIRNEIGSKHTKMIRQYLLKHSAYYVNQTEGDMLAFQNEMKVKVPITFIHNPIEYDDTYEGYDTDSNIIVTAGHFFKTKGYDLAVEVAKIVFESHPDWKWHLYGDGRETDTIKKQVKEYGLEKNVILCGRVKEIQEEYKKAAMYVMTSRTEGFGLVLTEAKSVNLPTIAFDCEFGPREIVDNDVSGFLIPKYDVEKMAEKINLLIENPILRKQFSDNARNNMFKFSVDMFYEKWIKVIEAI